MLYVTGGSSGFEGSLPVLSPEYICSVPGLVVLATICALVTQLPGRYIERPKFGYVVQHTAACCQQFRQLSIIASRSTSVSSDTS
jgi:hypothetical protein